MYHWVILLGLLLGVGECLLVGVDHYSGMWEECICFFVRVIGTCAVFYGFFLCRMLGAGDIKLMAVCVGMLGVWRGMLVIFSGMVLALFWACCESKVWKNGWSLLRGKKLRLAPYLLAGYVVTLGFGWLQVL